MDAATPFRRWLRTAGLLALATAGCHSTDPKPVGRGQLPADPRLPAPVAPGPVPPGSVAGSPVAGSPATPGVAPAAVVGQPVAGQPVGGPAAALTVTPASLSAPRRDAEKPPGAPRIKPVAYVGGENIVNDEEVWEAVRQRREFEQLVIKLTGDERAAAEKKLYDEELRRTIERELILVEMYARLKKAGKLAVIDDIKKFAGDTADRSVREMQGMGVSDEDFRAILGSRGLSPPVIRRQIERQIMADEYVRSMAKEKRPATGLAEVRAYYTAHPDEFRTPDRVKWLHVFVSETRFPTRRAAYDHALAVQQAAAGGADFVALSKKYDNGFAANQNGEGAGTERGKIVPAELEPAVWELPPGRVSGLLETATGYHIIKVATRDAAALRPLDEKIQAGIRQKLTGQFMERERQRLVEDLWRRGVVKVIDGGS